MFRTAFVRRLAAIPALLLAPAVIAMRALHLELNSAEPKVNGTVETSPTVLKLWFTEPITAKGTTVRVTNAKNEAIKLGEVTVDTPPLAPAVVKVLGAMGSGAYTVSWRAVGDDGHPATGKYKFTVK